MHDPRSHLYRTIHKAVRLLLSELSVLAGSTDFSAPAELEALRTRVRRDFAMLAAHAHHEDEFVRPLLERYRPNLAEHLGLAHAEQHATMPALVEDLANIDPASPAAAERGAHFCTSLSRYIADQLAHMADEEELAMPALYEVLDDPSLIAVHDALVASVPPEEMMAWLVYMIPAASSMERAGLLLGMQSKAPAQVFAHVLALAKGTLSSGAYDDLTRRLAVAA